MFNHHPLYSGKPFLHSYSKIDRDDVSRSSYRSGDGIKKSVLIEQKPTLLQAQDMNRGKFKLMVPMHLQDHAPKQNCQRTLKNGICGGHHSVKNCSIDKKRVKSIDLNKDVLLPQIMYSSNILSKENVSLIDQKPTHNNSNSGTRSHEHS